MGIFKVYVQVACKQIFSSNKDVITFFYKSNLSNKVSF